MGCSRRKTADVPAAEVTSSEMPPAEVHPSKMHAPEVHPCAKRFVAAQSLQAKQQNPYRSRSEKTQRTAHHSPSLSFEKAAHVGIIARKTSVKSGITDL